MRKKRKPTVPQVVLGLFIVGQLAFLVVANAASFLRLYLPNAPEAPARVGRLVAAPADFWAQLTAQEQNWRLFAPNVQGRALTVEATFTGDTPPPPAPTGFHWPGSGDRLWHAENAVAWPMVAYDPAAVVERPGEWRDYLEARVRANARFYRGYLAWMRRCYRSDHPDLPPQAEGRLGVWVFTRSRQADPSRPEVFVPLPLQTCDGQPKEARR